MTAADPGATPTAARSPTPDLARGGMPLLIAPADVHLYVHGRPLGPRGYPGDVEGVDRYVAVVRMALVDGRPGDPDVRAAVRLRDGAAGVPPASGPRCGRPRSSGSVPGR